MILDRRACHNTDFQSWRGDAKGNLPLDRLLGQAVVSKHTERKNGSTNTVLPVGRLVILKPMSPSHLLDYRVRVLLRVDYLGCSTRAAPTSSKRVRSVQKVPSPAKKRRMSSGSKFSANV